MNCLHCGDCCLRMSPVSQPEPCPLLIVVDNFYFCGDYNNRPKECKNHLMPYRHCPIGIEKLKLQNPLEISRRIDNGWELSKQL